MLCFNKLTGEHNGKKYLKKFSFCGSISLSGFAKECHDGEVFLPIYINIYILIHSLVKLHV